MFVRARMRSEQGWSDVTIANASSRGLMLQSTAPLQRNAFIEVRHGSVCIVGRIVWSSGPKCGVRTQDPVDVGVLLSPAPDKGHPTQAERRSAPRPSEKRRPPADELAESSSRFARAFDWIVMTLLACGVGGFMAHAAWTALDAPLAQVTAALARPG